ncbi:hypothetical protein AAC387_Pa02g4951 [Persea americana]
MNAIIIETYPFLCFCFHTQKPCPTISYPCISSSSLPPPSSLQLCLKLQAPPHAADSCNDIFLYYTFRHHTRIHPYLPDPSLQSYSFRSTATILNTNTDELKSWNIIIGFKPPRNPCFCQSGCFV